jgi:polysaccharide chain length determinant protein (PEP-CTERM system associated)
MQQEFSEIYFLIKGTLKYKRIAIFLSLILCICAWIFVFLMPDKYESKAKVHIDTANVIRPLMKGMVIDPDVGSMIRIIQQLMFTQPNLEKIVELSLINKHFKDGQEKIDFFEKLKKEITIKSGGNRDIFDIAYSSDNPEAAKSVVQAVLTVFSENTQGKAQADASDAHNFIEQQIRDYEIRLQEAEKAKEEFKRSNIDLLVDSGQVNNLQGVKKELENAKTLLQQAQAKKNVLSEQLKQVQDSAVEDWGGSNISQEVSDDDARIKSLQNKKTDLLLKYTDRHPDIAEIDNLIESLQKQNKQNKKSVAGENDADHISVEKLSNPYVQTLKTAYDNAEGETAAAQALVDSLNERVAKLGEGLKDKLSLETEMMNLNRDYETISKQYANLLERREQAHITEKIDDQTSRLKFNIADPPSRPVKPSFPNRPIFYSAALILSVVIGFGIAFLIYFVKPVFMSVKQVKSVTGLPTLGNVSMVLGMGSSQSNKDWIFNFSVVSLLVAYTGVMIYELIK